MTARHNAVSPFHVAVDVYRFGEEPPCSDRELAAAAWPNAEPWGDLSSQECEEAIRRQLNSAPNSTDTGQ